MRELIDWYRVFDRVPEIMGLELVRNGKSWTGRYYINGNVHPYRADKLKCKIYQSMVFVYEQGGESLSLPEWLVTYGGAKDYKEAYERIRGVKLTAPVKHEVRETKVLHVSPDVLYAARGYDLHRCSLFNWMCTMFPEQRVMQVWNEYNVTTDWQGNAVFWYVDRKGRILHDKRIRYGEDGHRIKDCAMNRKFRVGDGYSGRCWFGEHLIEPGRKTAVVESEKTCLLFRLYYKCPVVATGGKGNLHGPYDNLALYPDLDAVEEWRKSGAEVREWWKDLPEELGKTADIGDLIDFFCNKRKNAYICQK